jgi:uncharacterized protein
MNASPNHPALSPIEKKSRIVALDVMRGIVLFGILLMNINGFGLAHAYSNPTISGGSTGLDLITWITTNMLFEGTMRALFSLLFGVGMFVLLDGLERRGAGIKGADIYFRRLLWLLFFGLVHGYLLLWIGEILYQYAIMGLLVYSFRNMIPTKLIAIAVFLFAAGSLWNYMDYRKEVKFMEDVAKMQALQAENKPLDRDLQKVSYKWDQRQWDRSAAGVAEYNENMRKGYFQVVAFLAPQNQRYDEHWSYRYDLFDVFSMMLLGIALFKLKLLSAEKPYTLYALIAAIGYLVGLSVNYYEVNLIMTDNFSSTAFAKSNITYDLGRVFVAMGHIGLIMMFCKVPTLRWLKNGLSAVGKMALTNYLMHSVICLIIFTGVGFGQFGKLLRHELIYVVVSIWIFQLIISPIWLRYFQYGPMEWLWRSLSYQKRQPFKLSSAQTKSEE